LVASIIDQEIIMLKRTLTSSLIAIFVATGALAATVQSSSAYGMHHHHDYYEDYPDYPDYPDYWWYYHHHHHHHHHHHIIIY
jgi:hypothetical protein